MDNKKKRTPRCRAADSNNCSGAATAAAGGVGGAGGGGSGGVVVKEADCNGGGGRFGRGEGRGGIATNFGRPRRSSGSDSPWSASRAKAAFVDVKRQGLSGRKAATGNRSADRHGSQVTEVEVGSASRPGGRKPSLNHLLNFTYDTYDTVARGHNRTSGGGGSAPSANGSAYAYGHGGGMWATRKHKYNKEQFLQANCQFVVREGGDYAVHSADPDLLVDWEWIEQVRIPGHEFPSCPICLYPPVAAKVTRCGHVYCWTCMLHYLALSDKTWRKCPICYEAVHKGDLKSVVSLETAFYRVGDTIRMQLMRRERGSVISLPRAHWNDLQTRSNGCLALDAAAGDTCYAKLLVASREQVLEVLDREEVELVAALYCGPGAELEPESCFVEDALEQLKVRRGKMLDAVHGKMEAEDNQPAEEEKEEEEKEKKEEVDVEKERKKEEEEEKEEQDEKTMEIHVKCDPAFAHGERVEEATDDVVAVDVQAVGSKDNMATVDADADAEVAELNESSQPPRGKNTYYFYQAMDGQHIYMHSVNVAMLVREHGCLEKCPDVVTARIVERESVTMNDELRRRLRCLAHLPLTCQFELVELDFSAASVGPGLVVSSRTLLAFRDEIKKRNQRRSRRAFEENRRERKIRHDIDMSSRCAFKKAIRVPRLHLDNPRHFPACGGDGGSGSGSSSSSNGGASDETPTPTDELNGDVRGSNHLHDQALSNDRRRQQEHNLQDQQQQPQPSASPSSSWNVSFAQMLRAGKAKRDVAPMVAVGRQLNRRQLCRSEHVQDEWNSDVGSPVPSFAASFWAALEESSLAVPSGDDEEAEAEADGDDDAHHQQRRCRKGGGKKANKRLLFSTSIVHSQ